MPETLSQSCNIVRHSNAVAAGTTDITPSTPIDMAGYEGCLFIAEFGAITATAVTSIKVAQCDTSGGTYADLEGTSVSVTHTSDNKMAYIDIKNPGERYLKCIVDRGTANAVLEGITAIQYSANDRPVTQGSTVAGGEIHNGPAEGTA